MILILIVIISCCILTTLTTNVLVILTATATLDANPATSYTCVCMYTHGHYTTITGLGI